MTETWVPVPGYEGRYSVSDSGRVIRHAWTRVQPNGGHRHFPEIVMAANVGRLGYPQLFLWRDGKARSIKVANLVLLAFIGPRPPGLFCCHNDGIRTNSALSNLRYDTPKANYADRRRHGTDHSGERNPRAKLNREQINLIRADPRKAATVAMEFGVSPTTVWFWRRRVNFELQLGK